MPPPPNVVVVKPVMTSVQSWLEYNGYLEPVESVDIRARVKGYLTQVHFKEGEEIEAGHKLYTIDPREFVAAIAKSKADIAKAVADMANAKAQIKLAEADYDRMFKLKGSISQSELDKAIATVDSNKALVDVAAANKAAAEASLQTAELDLSYTDIRAPIAGRISRTMLTPGNLVGQNESTLLTTIVSVDPLYVYFDAPEKDLVTALHTNQGQQAGAASPSSLPVEIGVATEEGFPHRGMLDFRENRVTTETGTVRMRGRISNPIVPPGNSRILYPGLYAKVRIPNGSAKQQFVLPEEALMTGQEGRFIYVVGKENKVEKRTVTVGTIVWRAPQPAAAPAPQWIINNPNPTPPPVAGAPASPPAPSAPPATTIPIRSIIAVEKGLEPNDLVIVSGLQKVRPGAPVTPEAWDLVPPPVPQAK